VTVLSDTASARGLETVLSAYSALGEGDAAPVLELLAPDVEWWSQGVRALPRPRGDGAGIRPGAPG
jgi:ketosteroid isomerase-like protein